MSDLIRREDVLMFLREWTYCCDVEDLVLTLTAEPVQAQIHEARLRETLHDLITEQSEGEWDDKTINTDVEVFLTAILALIRKGDQP